MLEFYFGIKLKLLSVYYINRPHICFFFCGGLNYTTLHPSPLYKQSVQLYIIIVCHFVCIFKIFFFVFRGTENETLDISSDPCLTGGRGGGQRLGRQYQLQT